MDSVYFSKDFTEYFDIEIKPEFIDKISNNICKTAGCYNEAEFSYSSELSDQYCSKHKRPRMIRLTQNKCTIHPNCQNKAKYFYYSLKSNDIRACIKHKSGPLFEDNLKCLVSKCRSKPTCYPIIDKSMKPLLCKKHTTDGFVITYKMSLKGFQRKYRF